MKQVKKLFAGVLALCMLFTFMPAAMAEDTVTYKLQGETNIFAPPAGKIAEIPYTIIKTTTTETTDEGTGDPVTTSTNTTIATTLTIEGAPDGVTLNDTRTALLINGTSVKSGSFTITATATDGETDPITKTVTVEEYRIYEDFESQVAGSKALVYARKIADPTTKANVQNGSSITITETDGNKYVNATNTWGSYYLEIKPENNSAVKEGWIKTRYVTFEFDVNGYYQYSNQPILYDNTNKNFGVGTQNFYIVNMYKPAGNTESTGLVYTKYPNGWAKMQMIVDYYAREYTFTVNGTKYGPYSMQNDKGTYPQQLWFGRPIDNLSVYSGKPGTKKIGTITGDATLLAPPAGIKSAVQYSVLDGATVLNGAEWSIEGSLAGVSVDNNGRIILDGDSITTNGSVTLVAQTDLIKATKTISLSPYRIFEDFQDQEVGANFKITPPNLDGTTTAGTLNQYDVKVAAENNNNKYFSPDTTKDEFGGILFKWGANEFQNVVKASSTTVVTLSYKAKDDCQMLSGGGTRPSVGFKEGVFSVNQTAALGNKAESGWMEIRLVLDYTDAANPTYKVYVDDALVAKDVAIGYYTSSNDNFGYRLGDIYFYNDMDDFAYYSGEKIVEDYVTVDDVAYESGSVLSSGSHTVKAHLGNLDISGKKLFMAHYDGNVLNKVSILTSNFAEMSARLDNISGGEVRIFLWDGNLVPIEIESIPTTIN